MSLPFRCTIGFVSVVCAIAFALPCCLGQAPATESDPRSNELEQSAQELVQRLVDGHIDKVVEDFDSAMAAALSQDQLREVWQGIEKGLGKFERFESFRLESIPTHDITLLTCKFANSSIVAKIVFAKDGKIAGLFFLPTSALLEYTAPDYFDSDSFEETQVAIGQAPWMLPATFTLPKVSDKVPAIILVHGSGPNDRDESVGANKPFKDLAGGLASKGIAVLRYEKRTRVHGAELPPDLTVQEETIDDVIAAVDWLSQRKNVDPSRIFVLGHSLGGCLVPRMDATDSSNRIAGYVIMAGNTRPMEDLISEQTAYILGLDGEVSDEEQQHLAEINKQVQQVKSLQFGDQSQSLFGAPLAYWSDLAGYQPHEKAKSITEPVLILHGDRDYQVTAKDFANWQNALSDRANVELKSYPNLNHLMIEGSGPSQPEEYAIPGHVAAEVINDIAQWIIKQPAG